MGGDGGATVSRDILVSVRKHKGLEQDPRLIAHGRYTHCAISGQPLQSPIVACYLGNLYNKEAVITMILSRKKKHSEKITGLASQNPINIANTDDFTHIQRLKDVITCQVTWYTPPATSSPAGGNNQTTHHDEVGTTYICCPITNEKADGGQQFVVMKSCGCVLSLKGYHKLITSSINHDTLKGRAFSCVVCSQAFPPAFQHRDTLIPPSSYTLTNPDRSLVDFAFIPLIPDAHQLDYLTKMLPQKRTIKAKVDTASSKIDATPKRQRITDDKASDQQVITLQSDGHENKQTDDITSKK